MADYSIVRDFLPKFLISFLVVRTYVNALKLYIPPFYPVSSKCDRIKAPQSLITPYAYYTELYDCMAKMWNEFLFQSYFYAISTMMKSTLHARM